MASTADLTQRTMSESLLTVSEVHSVDEFLGLRGEWTSLLERTRAASIFHTWEWLFQWWTTFGEEHILRIFCVRDSERCLQGIWPLYERVTASGITSRRRLEYLGTGEPEAEEVATEYADILAERDAERAVVQSLWQYIASTTWDQIYMPKTLSNSCIVEVLLPLIAETTGINVTKAPVGARYFIQLPKSWDEYLERLGKRKRKRIQNYRRRLVREGGFAQRLVTESNDVVTALDTLAELHEVRWSSRGKCGAFESARFREFHRAISQELLPSGRLDLRLWRYADKDVAALYGFRWDNTLSYYQSGFDTSATGSVSLGLMAVMDTIEWAIDHGYERFDFMGGGDTSYKEDYECETVSMLDVTLYNTTIRGLFHFVNRTARDIARGALRSFRSTPPVMPSNDPDGA